jgi:hypothetical protein
LRSKRQVTSSRAWAAAEKKKTLKKLESRNSQRNLTIIAPVKRAVRHRESGLAIDQAQGICGLENASHVYWRLSI